MPLPFRPHSCAISTGLSQRQRFLAAGVIPRPLPLLFSGVFGWWGFPWGLVMTPVQLARNLVELTGGPKSDAPSALLQEFRAYYGPTMSAFEAAEKNGRAGDLQKELEELFNRENKSPDKNATSIPATFLRVTVAV